MTLTIASNLRRAFIDRETIKIGGGEFTPEECKEAALQLASFDELLAALEALLNYGNLGAYDRADAMKAARAAIAKARGTD